MALRAYCQENHEIAVVQDRVWGNWTNRIGKAV